MKYNNILGHICVLYTVYVLYCWCSYDSNTPIHMLSTVVITAIVFCLYSYVHVIRILICSYMYILSITYLCSIQVKYYCAYTKQNTYSLVM